MRSISDHLSSMDKQMQHLEFQIEHQRKQIVATHPSHRISQVRVLQDLLGQYGRLKANRSSKPVSIAFQNSLGPAAG